MKKRLQKLPAVFALLLGNSLFAAPGAAATSGESNIVESRLGQNGAPIPVVDGEVMVTLKDGAEKRLAKLLAKYGMKLKKHYGKRDLYLLKTDPTRFARIKQQVGSTDIASIVRTLRSENSFLSVEPNAVCSSNGGSGDGGWRYVRPDDPNYGSQWNLWRWDMLAMSRVWGTEMGDKDVIIAILDSGIAYEDYADDTHEYVRMPDFRKDLFVEGFDFINDDTHPNDDFNHGTHIAGIICADFSNHTGIAGIAPDCSIMPVKILDSAGHGSVISLIEGIDYAVENGANVINLSVSFPNGYVPGQALHQCLADAHAAGVVLVASSGNEGLSQVSYPAAFNECIAVGALTSQWWWNERAEYSNWGPALDVMAPGGDNVDRNWDGAPDAILSTAFGPGKPTENIGYWLGSGTSQAAAHVSALAGLLFAHGAKDADVVRNAILKTSYDMYHWGYDEYSGYGSIDPYYALANYPYLKAEPVEHLLGYVPARIGVAVPDDFIGMVMSFDERLVLFLDAPDGLFAMVDWSPPSDSIAVYQVTDYTLQELIDLPGGALSFIEDSGGIIQFLNDTGGLIQFLNDTGGLIMFLDDTGGIIQFLNDSGGLIMFLDDTGGIIQFLNDSGGLIQFLNDTGGLIQFLNDTGGLIQFLNDTGGLIGLLDMESNLYAGSTDIYGNSVNPLEAIMLDQLEFFCGD